MPGSDIVQGLKEGNFKDTKDFFLIYREHFLPAYSDLVVLTINKPSIVLFEIESAFAHLMKYVMDEDAETNLKKAKGHIYRASVDCYKLLWEFIYEVVFEVDSYRGAYTGDESELLSKLRRLSEKMTDARLCETQSVGSESEEILTMWKDALAIGMDIYNSTNKTLLKKMKRKDRYRGTFPTYIYPLILAAASLVIGIIVGHFIR